MSEAETFMPRSVAAVLPEEVIRQRALGWPDFHPEEFCHRCGRRNVSSWYVDSDLWDAATEGRERGGVDILCPPCFVELFERASQTSCSWELRLDIQNPGVRPQTGRNDD